MVGIALIGDSRNAERNRPTSLPAEARSLSRLLRILKSPETAAKALTVTLETFPRPEDPRQLAALSCLRSQVAQVIEDMREGEWNLPEGYPEYNMSMAVEAVLREPSSFSAPENPQRQLGSVGMDGDSSVSTTSQIIPVDRANPFCNPATELAHPWGQFIPGTPLNTAGISVAVVSDHSSAEDDDVSTTETRRLATVTEQVQQIETQLDFNQTNFARRIWAVLLESVHLQVASRTTKVWGRKKIYEVYRLTRPVQDFSAGQEAYLRSSLEAECRSLFKCYFSDQSHCRVYTTLQPLSELKIARALYVQISLGKPYDLQDETNRAASGEKKKKHEKEFIAVLVPGSPFFALTASRAPSRSRFTPSVYTILETVLTETAKTYAAAMTSSKVDKEAVKRFGDLSGTEPQELLRAARSIVEGEATGRYAFMASKDQSNPVEDLHAAATGDLLRPASRADEKRISVGMARAGLAVANEAAKVAASYSAAALVAASNSGDNLWLDHSMHEKQVRKRAREKELGGRHDCPKLQRICWKWSGETSAASTCWLDQDNKVATTEDRELPQKTKFKCAVVMKGENVLGAMQALLEAGLMDGPLPDFLRDAPALGGTIRVDHGSFVGANAPYEDI